MRIVTNFARFPQSWTAANGMKGESLPAATVQEFWRLQGRNIVWLVNCDTTITLELGARKLLSPNAAALVAADLVMRAPQTFQTRALLPVKKLFLSRVDHFIHYFRDLEGYQRLFGIGRERSSFVPFKVNLVDRFRVEPAGGEGEYILCLGRSMRDFDTFFDAMELLPSLPGAITPPDPRMFARHGARFTRPVGQLPKNVRVLADDGGDESMMQLVGGAKLVVLPVLKSSLVASGISTGLNAMVMGRCVIGSEGPGMSDIFKTEVLTAPPENAAALAAVIRRAWEDNALRARTAAAGRRYALAAGGEPELYQRVVDQVASLQYGARD